MVKSWQKNIDKLDNETSKKLQDIVLDVIKLNLK
jgi:hypothetical protein